MYGKRALYSPVLSDDRRDRRVHATKAAAVGRKPVEWKQKSWSCPTSFYAQGIKKFLCLPIKSLSILQKPFIGVPADSLLCLRAFNPEDESSSKACGWRSWDIL
jgi:hypothetical protein